MALESHSASRMKPRWKVVIVDDHAASRSLVAETVGAQGGLVAGNGSRVEDAVLLVERHKPDVAVLAVGLIDGDGVDAAHQVMATCPCALVLLTSRTDSHVAARAVDAGVLGFLVKPLRPEELGPTLDLAVSRFRELTAARKENEELKRKLEGKRLIDRAKALLIQRLGLTEAEAHRRLQKTAMDTRRPMASVAQAVLLTADARSARPSK